MLALVAVSECLGVLSLQGRKSNSSTEAARPLGGLKDLLSLPQDELRRVDIARMNLLCAQSLPGAEELNVAESLASLDAMATRVKDETQRHLYRFRENPGQFENSEGFFRMIMVAVVLAEDFGVKYAPDKIGTVADARTGDGFFGDAHDVFLHGLTGAKHQGTCSSLPVLQVAVGRRLGYPLKLVTTRGHLFLRWEDSHERFNIEAAGNGVNRFSDDYYRHWPVEVSEQEIQAEGYLRSLTPAEELAVFMSIRGACWRDAGQYAEAVECFRAASRLAPGCRGYQVLAAELDRTQKPVAAIIGDKN